MTKFAAEGYSRIYLFGILWFLLNQTPNIGLIAKPETGKVVGLASVSESRQRVRRVAPHRPLMNQDALRDLYRRRAILDLRELSEELKHHHELAMPHRLHVIVPVLIPAPFAAP